MRAVWPPSTASVSTIERQCSAQRLRSRKSTTLSLGSLDSGMPQRRSSRQSNIGWLDRTSTGGTEAALSPRRIRAARRAAPSAWGR